MSRKTETKYRDTHSLFFTDVIVDANWADYGLEVRVGGASFDEDGWDEVVAFVNWVKERKR